jgi:hypothetical protein
MRIILTIVFLSLTSTQFAQLLTKYDDFGVTGQSRVLMLNKSDKISKEMSYNYSFGLYYDFVNSDFYSIPIYATYARDNYNFKDIAERTNQSYFDFELAYRRHIIFNLGSRIYLEAGIQNRFLLNSNRIVTSNNEELFLRKYYLIPKLGIGIEIYGKQKPFVYLNLEYWNSVQGLFENENTPLNKYFGLKASFPIIQ